MVGVIRAWPSWLSAALPWRSYGNWWCKQRALLLQLLTQNNLYIEEAGSSEIFYKSTRPHGVTPQERVIRKIYTQYLSDGDVLDMYLLSLINDSQCLIGGVDCRMDSACTYFHRQETQCLMDGTILRRPLRVYTFTDKRLSSVWQMALIVRQIRRVHTFTDKRLSV